MKRSWWVVFKDLVRDLDAYPIWSETRSELRRALWDAREPKAITPCSYNWPGVDGVVHRLVLERNLHRDPYGEEFMTTRKITACGRFVLKPFSPRATRAKVTCLGCLSNS